MEAREHLFYGLGIVAFAVARADGEIQPAERQELHDIITQWSSQIDSDFDISEIIFSVLKKSKPRLNEGFETGMKYIRLGENHLNEGLKEKFVFLIRDIAHAFPPVTVGEEQIIRRFEAALAQL